MLPVIEKFMAARRLPDVTVVADAGMISEAKRTRFIALDGAVKSVNCGLEARARDLAGPKRYVTSLEACPTGRLSPRTS